MHRSKSMNAVFGMLCAGALLSACGPSAPSEADKIKRGEYLVAIAACGDCHTPGALMGQPDMAKVFSGGNVGFHLPTLGYFYPPNLTPDDETGLGKWSEEEIANAIRKGARPDGRQLAPVMPYGWYAKLTEDDALAMAAYLKSLAPLSNKVPDPLGDGETPTAPYMPVVVPPAPASAADAANPETPQ